ncbi:MAG: NTP transferase domain-containing protein, partial [Phycisphaerae bacterium]
MIDSIRLGVKAWQNQTAINPHDGILVCPADLPTITTADFDACTAAFRRQPDRIVIGTHAGRRGHPLIFPAELIGFVKSTQCDQGLHALPRMQADRVLYVPCPSPGVTRDVDTPDDLSSLDAGHPGP